jgi:predicted nucleic acid-binding Zn ribbon protein
MNATITEPMQIVLDQLPDDLSADRQRRSRTPVVFTAVLIAVIVALVLMRRRGASDETASYDAADAPVTGDAAFVDVR